MAGETVITIVGNLTADPEVRTTSAGAQVASFTIASTPRSWNRGTNQFEDGQALFLRCSAWRDLARARPGQAYATLLRGEGRYAAHGCGIAGG